MLRVYYEYTTGDSSIAKQNRYLLGFWQVSAFRVSYCLPKLMRVLGRSRSSINAAFTACGWLVRPIGEEDFWGSALCDAVPRLGLSPNEARTWTTRGIDRPTAIANSRHSVVHADEKQSNGLLYGRVQFPPCETLEFRL